MSTKKELKYGVGQEVQWDGADGNGCPLDDPQKVVLHNLTVTDPYFTGYDWEITSNNGTTWRIKEPSLSPLDDNHTLKYKVGQEVQWDGTDVSFGSPSFAQKVRIKKVDNGGTAYPYRVEASGNMVWLEEHRLSPLDDNHTLITAIKGSRAHHMEGVMCTEKNYQEFKTTSDYCDLCKYYGFKRNKNEVEVKKHADCSKCFLNDADGVCCAEWRRAKLGHITGYFSEFHAGEAGILGRLDAKLDELEGAYNGFGDYYKDMIDSHQKDSLRYMVGGAKKQQGYQVGDEFVCHGGTVWGGMKCKVDRINDVIEKYEMIGFTDNLGALNGGCFNKYPPHEKLYQDSAIIRCIDPRYWTKEVDGVLYRAYENKQDELRIYWDDGKEHDWTSHLISDLPQTLWDVVVKIINIPIMPYGYMGDDYEFEYPVREDK